jgi:hypothetical protein
MKSVLLACCLLLAGCQSTHAPTPPTAPLIPGATSNFDQDTYRTLATAHAFAAQASSNPAVLTTAQKAVLNRFIIDLNAADQLYSAYHVGQATQAEMQAELTTVQNDQASYVQTAGVK